MPLNPKIVREVADLLSPFCRTPDEQEALLVLSLGAGHPLLNHVTFGNNPATFISKTINRLYDYGEVELGRTALWAVLEYVHDQVGYDKQLKIMALRYEVNPGLKPPAPPLAAIPIEPPEPPEDDANPEIEAILEQIADAESIQVWGEVIELGEQILAINPKHKVARERIAHAYYRRSQRYTYYNASVDALEDFTQAIEYDPNNPIYYFERGRLYWWRSRYRRAIKDFTSALELEPGNLQYLYWRGMCYLRCGNKEAAQIDFGSARQSA
jgi:tetratricopeptide (TPR) repeat protein